MSSVILAFSGMGQTPGKQTGRFARPVIVGDLKFVALTGAVAVLSAAS
jgi:hypothetical protein